MTEKLLGNQPQGKLFIISSPSGTGKTTLVEKLMQEFPDKITRSITCTTRSARENELEGKDYFFLTEEEFHHKAKQGEFLESAEVFGYHYGTLKADVEKLLSQGRHVILVIDTQGAKQVKRQRDAVSIFISPPSMEELDRRLQKRGTETKQSLERRLRKAEEEMKEISHYDYHMVNDQLQTAYQVLKSIIIAEEHKVKK